MVLTKQPILFHLLIHYYYYYMIDFISQRFYISAELHELIIAS